MRVGSNPTPPSFNPPILFGGDNVGIDPEKVGYPDFTAIKNGISKPVVLIPVPYMQCPDCGAMMFAELHVGKYRNPYGVYRCLCCGDQVPIAEEIDLYISIVQKFCRSL